MRAGVVQRGKSRMVCSSARGDTKQPLCARWEGSCRLVDQRGLDPSDLALDRGICQSVTDEAIPLQLEWVDGPTSTLALSALFPRHNASTKTEQTEPLV